MKKIYITKKLICILVAMALVLTLVPAYALAEGEAEPEQESAIVPMDTGAPILITRVDLPFTSKTVDVGTAESALGLPSSLTGYYEDNGEQSVTLTGITWYCLGSGYDPNTKGDYAFAIDSGNPPAGYELSGLVAEIIITVADPTPIVTNAVLQSAVADGAAGQTTSTKIDLTFDVAVSGLEASHITITGGTGSAVAGAVSGSGTSWSVALSSVAEGTVSLAVASPPGYAISGVPVDVAVYKSPAGNVFDVADGPIVFKWLAGAWSVTQGSGDMLPVTPLPGNSAENRVVLTGSTANAANYILVDGAGVPNRDANRLYLTFSGLAVTNYTHAPFEVQSGAHADIELAAGTQNVLEGDDFAALQVPAGAAATIGGSGVLQAITSNGAGIGGGYNQGNGDITINGGDVEASSAAGAGIGGGYGAARGATLGAITINGGSVSAQSLVNTGIGGGYGGFSLTVTGGDVSAVSGWSAGIGVLFYDRPITVTVTGGSVTAIASTHSPGIQCVEYYGQRDSVRVSGGTVIAAGAGVGAGIGGATKIPGDEIADALPGGDIAISGGSVTASGGAQGGAGIGGGSCSEVSTANTNQQGGAGGDITISGGNVTATGGIGGAGIGGGSASAISGYKAGNGGNGGSISITGGNVTAVGTDGGAGIGGGSTGLNPANSDSGGLGGIPGDVSITGGVVNATATGGGDGIGFGMGKKNGGGIAIGGDAIVTAQGTGSKYGITSADMGAQSIVITGGSVYCKTPGGEFWGANPVDAVGKPVYCVGVPKDYMGAALLDQHVAVDGKVFAKTAGAGGHGDAPYGAYIYLPEGVRGNILVGDNAGSANVTKRYSPDAANGNNVVLWKSVYDVSAGNITFKWQNGGWQAGIGTNYVTLKDNSAEKPAEITGTTGTYTVSVQGASGATPLYLRAGGLTMTQSEKLISPFAITSADVRLEIPEGADVSLTSTQGGGAGLRVPGGASVSISGGGSLSAKGSADIFAGAAGIGGISGEAAGNVSIDGCAVEAVGGGTMGGGAGIGGGSGANGGDVTIISGSVIATGAGSIGGAGIGAGSGSGMTAGTIDISSGSVVAEGSLFGIRAENVKIANDAAVTAKGMGDGTYAVGIAAMGGTASIRIDRTAGKVIASGKRSADGSNGGAVVAYSGGGIDLISGLMPHGLNVQEGDDSVSYTRALADADGVLESVEITMGYYTIEGPDGSTVSDGTSDIVFTMPNGFLDLRGIAAANTELDPDTDLKDGPLGNLVRFGSKATAENGSTIVTLHKEYLQTLADGTYPLEVRFVGGTVRTEFTIRRSMGTGGTMTTIRGAKTGDESPAGLWGTIAFTSIVMLCAAIWLRKRKKA